ncbi:MAG: arsenate reductase (glutaredoxin) [Euryarchaeota archaeon]|nr:arsenate reductase (glutaredoxin) [Euryarchaeota archaeon]
MRQGIPISDCLGTDVVTILVNVPSFQEDMGTLYHNPRCSKSRQALEIVQQSGVDCNVVEYLKHPLDAEQLLSLLSRLSGEIKDIIRTNESEYKQSGFDSSLSDDRRAVSQLLEEYPRLMQRPIYDNGEEAVIGRPPESIKEIL